MRTRIDGAEVAFEPGPGSTAVEVIRRVAGRTGTKVVCGSGVCGACTIHLDGRAVTSCILPAHVLDGADVRTVEGLAAAGGGLHPVQKAFIAADGLQCGFCTPGFVMETVTFYERWKAAGRTGTPARDEIAAALSGHLCRCGSYIGIFEAVRRVCGGEFDGDPEPGGPRVEATEKVTGRARYTFDIQLEGQLEGRVVRSRHPHAIVESIALDGARSVEGVEAVVRLLDEDDPHVRYVGQPVAAIAATSTAALVEAARRLDVRYRTLPAVLDLAEAITGPATAYEKRRPDAPNSSEGPIPPGKWDGNVRRTRGLGLLSWRPGKARRLIERARDGGELELVSARFTTPAQIHAAFEPHCAVARWPGRESLEVWASTQSLDRLRTELAERFGLDRSGVRVTAEHVGGAFGAKQGLQSEILAAVALSRAAGGAPVRVANDRLDEMAVGGYRPGTRVEIDLVADRSGDLKAIRMAATGDAGVAVNSTVAILGRLFYTGVPKALDDRDVVTNLPPGKPFRGPFGPPFFLAVESAVDDMAFRLGRDPLELRAAWDDHALRRTLYDRARELEVWRSRGAPGEETGRFRRGVGAAMAGWATAYWAGTEVDVTISAEGIVAGTATQDVGNGSRSVLAQAVAEVLGVPRSDVRVRIGTSTDARGPASVTSRSANSLYVAGRKAAEEARSRLVAAARSAAGLGGVREVDGGLEHDGGLLSWREVAGMVGPASARARRGRNGPFDLLGLIPSGKMALNVAPVTTGTVHVAAVVVDTRLGRVVPTRYWVGIAAGKIITPTLARRQIEGAVIQGIGYALYEERSVDRATGTVMNLGLEEFRIAGMADVPEVEVHFHEEGFEGLAGGAAGLSELAALPVSAAIGNAVLHATGRRFTEFPLRPGRILEGLA